MLRRAFIPVTFKMVLSNTVCKTFEVPEVQIKCSINNFTQPIVLMEKG